MPQMTLIASRKHTAVRFGRLTPHICTTLAPTSGVAVASMKLACYAAIGSQRPGGPSEGARKSIYRLHGHEPPRRKSDSGQFDEARSLLKRQREKANIAEICLSLHGVGFEQVARSFNVSL